MSTKIQTLRSSKKSAKTRLTKAKKQLNDLIEKQLPGVPLPSKNAIRRAINKVNSEISIIEKIISGLKEIYAVSAENDETNTVIETLDKELEDIGSSVDSIIVMAEQHLEERLGNGETDSVLTSLRSQETSPQSPVMSKKSSNVEQKQKEAKEASERLIQMENEQRVKELELQKLTAELQLTKQRTDDARKVAALNKSRAEEAERRSQVSDNDTVQNFLINRHLEKHSERPNENKEQRQTFSPIRLKGVDLPIFSGEEKSDYESWKAAFLSVVDRRDIPVGEKMLRLQGCLSGKALTMVKDLGYSLNAYERAKAKLEKKYGGERRLQIKHLTALRNFRKIRPRNLEDMEEFQVLLERVLIATQDSGPLHGQSLNLTAKEKLPEEDVQAYKYWLMDHSREDNSRQPYSGPNSRKSGLTCTKSLSTMFPGDSRLMSCLAAIIQYSTTY